MPVIDSNLLVAVIAAGSALLGSTIGQLGTLIQAHLTRKRERLVVTRDRFERLAKLSFDMHLYLQRGQRFDDIRRPGDVVSTIGSEMKILAVVYFLELQGAVDAVISDGMGLAEALEQEGYSEDDFERSQFVISQKSLMLLMSAIAPSYT